MDAPTSPQLKDVLASNIGRAVLGDVLANRKYDKLIEANGKTYRVVPLSDFPRIKTESSQQSSSK